MATRRGSSAARDTRATRAGVRAVPASSNGDDDGRKLVVTLGTEAAVAARRMAADMNASTAETVRRGLALLDLLQSLPAEEELVVRNTRTGDIERLRFHWGY
jgi:hypothetical protein